MNLFCAGIPWPAAVRTVAAAYRPVKTATIRQDYHRHGKKLAAREVAAAYVSGVALAEEYAAGGDLENAKAVLLEVHAYFCDELADLMATLPSQLTALEREKACRDLMMIVVRQALDGISHLARTRAEELSLEPGSDIDS